MIENQQIILRHGCCIELLGRLLFTSGNKEEPSFCAQKAELFPSGLPKFSLAYLDLPYGYTACKFDKRVDEHVLFCFLFRLLQEKSPIVAHASGKYANSVRTMFEKHHWEDIFWNKCFAGNHVQASNQHLKNVEPILVFTQDGKGPKYYPQKTPRDAPIKRGSNAISEAIPIRGEKRKEFDAVKKIYTDKFPTNLIEFSVRENRGDHPTQKPVRLAQYIIRTFTQPGEWVIDPTMGSGTVALACILEGRNFLGIEKDELYFQTAKNRVDALYQDLLDI